MAAARARSSGRTNPIESSFAKINPGSGGGYKKEYDETVELLSGTGEVLGGERRKNILNDLGKLLLIAAIEAPIHILVEILSAFDSLHDVLDLERSAITLVEHDISPNDIQKIKKYLLSLIDESYTGKIETSIIIDKEASVDLRNFPVFQIVMYLYTIEKITSIENSIRSLVSLAIKHRGGITRVLPGSPIRPDGACVAIDVRPQLSFNPKGNVIYSGYTDSDAAFTSPLVSKISDISSLPPFWGMYLPTSVHNVKCLCISFLKTMTINSTIFYPKTAIICVTRMPEHTTPDDIIGYLSTKITKTGVDEDDFVCSVLEGGITLKSAMSRVPSGERLKPFGYITISSGSGTVITSDLNHTLAIMSKVFADHLHGGALSVAYKSEEAGEPKMVESIDRLMSVRACLYPGTIIVTPMSRLYYGKDQTGNNVYGPGCLVQLYTEDSAAGDGIQLFEGSGGLTTKTIVTGPLPDDRKAKLIGIIEGMGGYVTPPDADAAAAASGAGGPLPQTAAAPGSDSSSSSSASGAGGPAPGAAFASAGGPAPDDSDAAKADAAAQATAQVATGNALVADAILDDISTHEYRNIRNSKTRRNNIHKLLKLIGYLNYLRAHHEKYRVDPEVINRDIDEIEEFIELLEKKERVQISESIDLKRHKYSSIAKIAYSRNTRRKTNKKRLTRKINKKKGRKTRKNK